MGQKMRRRGFSPNVLVYEGRSNYEAANWPGDQNCRNLKVEDRKHHSGDTALLPNSLRIGRCLEAASPLHIATL